MMFRRATSSSPAAANANYVNSATLPADLTCFLCKNIFKEPLILSCGHSFCHSCVRPWLRRSTICPFCRCPTLQPVPNSTMAQRVAEFRKHNTVGAKKADNFIRNAIRRTVHPSKEAKALQREVLRASQRRPKNVVLPEKTKVVVEQEAADEKKAKEPQPQQFPRMGNLRKSFARIRNKFGQQPGGGGKQSPVEQQQAKGSASESASMHSFQSAVTRSAVSFSSSSNESSGVLVIFAVGPDHQTDIARAFAAHLDNVELVDLGDSQKSPSELICAIGSADRVVLIYRNDQKESFERVRKVFEYYAPDALEKMGRKAKFVLIGLNIGTAGRKVDRTSGEKLAKLLGTRLSEIELAVLSKTFPIWFHPVRPKLAPNELVIRSPAISRNLHRPPPVPAPSHNQSPIFGSPVPLRRVPPPVAPRPIIRLIPSPPQRSISSALATPAGDIRPAMGLSASAIRRSSAKAATAERVRKEEGGRAGTGGGGCVLM